MKRRVVAAVVIGFVVSSVVGMERSPRKPEDLMEGFNDALCVETRGMVFPFPVRPELKDFLDTLSSAERQQLMQAEEAEIERQYPQKGSLAQRLAGRRDHLEDQVRSMRESMEQYPSAGQRQAILILQELRLELAALNKSLERYRLLEGTQKPREVHRPWPRRLY